MSTLMESGSDFPAAGPRQGGDGRKSTEMRVAVFCREHCPRAVRTIEHFVANGTPLALVVVETGTRKKLSATETAFAAAHGEFERVLRGEPRQPPAPRKSLARRLWSRLPAGVKTRLQRLLGRGRRKPRSAAGVEDCARRHGIPVARVEKHSSDAARAVLEDHRIAVVLLANSAWLIKEPLLSMKGTRIINVHPSVLPQHRSLDALPWSILQGDRIGHTAHFVDAGIDTGPILLFEEVPPVPGDTLLTVRERIDGRKPALFHKVVLGLADGSLVAAPQKAADGVHHRPMTVEELLQAEQALQRRLKPSTEY
jgi:folate-dependent phosphoribosylglycinamide formyltransferase PurN